MRNHLLAFSCKKVKFLCFWIGFLASCSEPKSVDSAWKLYWGGQWQEASSWGLEFWQKKVKKLELEEALLLWMIDEKAKIPGFREFVEKNLDQKSFSLFPLRCGLRLRAGVFWPKTSWLHLDSTCAQDELKNESFWIALQKVQFLGLKSSLDFLEKNKKFSFQKSSKDLERLLNQPIFAHFMDPRSEEYELVIAPRKESKKEEILDLIYEVGKILPAQIVIYIHHDAFIQNNALEIVKNKKSIKNSDTFYLCKKSICQFPVFSWKDLKLELK